MIHVLLLVLLLATLTPVVKSDDDHYLLSCGASSVDANSAQLGFDGQTWQTDNNNTFSTSFASTTAVDTSSKDGAPFSAARVFTANFTYSFPVSPGPKLIRLFFYTLPTPAFPAADAYITVLANSNYTLLRNFSAYLSPASYQGKPFVKKEFYISVPNSHLELKLFPSHRDSHAFVNGIEVVSVPNKIYVGSTPLINVASQETALTLSPTNALENIHRVNVGGTDVNPADDSSTMYRYWVSDDSYLKKNSRVLTGVTEADKVIKYTTGTPTYSAPPAVYRSFRSMGINVSNEVRRRSNVTWEFEVDLGFNYLVRLHWCEVVVDVNATNIRVFDVYISEQLADHHVDVFEQAPGAYTAFHKDYVVYMGMGSGDQSGSRGVLQLSLRPEEVSSIDILLNGLEIFKISRPDDSLDAPNPSGVLPISPTPSPRQQGSHSRVALVIIAAVTGAILIGVLLCFLSIYRRKKRWKKAAASTGAGSTKSKGLFFSFRLMKTTTKSKSGFNIPAHISRRFTLAQIRLATNDFSEYLIIGHGGFGNVYKGMLYEEKGFFAVAIKRSNPSSKQGVREFMTEIALLSMFHHVHLVSLIGYCNESGEMILVYEYMERGTLRDHLYDTNSSPLSWTQRLNACIGAAKGLHYLHAGESHMIIHRDVKSSNILLDKDWVPKVSDFGISKLGPMGDLSHVSTAVKGSFGYLDPEYFRCQRLTEKSDVYSFGVVLFEALCGRAALDPMLTKDNRNLALWAQSYQRKGELGAIVDPCIKGEIAPACLIKFGEIAGSCVRKHGTKRPSMADIIIGLELTLELQQHGSIILDELEFQPPMTNLSVSTFER